MKSVSHPSAVGNIWAGTDDGFLNCFDKEMSTFTHFEIDTTTKNNSTTALFIDKNNILWVGSKAGLSSFNVQQKKFINHFKANPEIPFNSLLVGPKNLKIMKDAGVNIGCGTDSGVPFSYHGTLWREMEILERVGFSNSEVLRCATINNAKIVGMADKIGSVEAGKYADLVILKENPLEKIETCRQPQMVIKDGTIYDVDKIVFNS